MCSKVSQVPSGPKAPSNSNALPATPIHIHACNASQTMAPCATNSLSEEDDELSDDEDLPSGIVGAPHIKADRARARGRKEPKPEQKALKRSLFEDTEVCWPSPWVFPANWLRLKNLRKSWGVDVLV